MFRAMTKSVPSCLAAAALAVPSALLLGGCDIEFPEQEIVFKANVGADTLDVFMIYRGVTADDDSDVAIEKAASAAETILAGRREFMFLDWPFHFDLDGGEWAAEAGPEARRIIANVSVEKVGAFFDARGRLSAYQHVRLREAKAFFGFLNEVVSRAVLEAERTGTLGDGAPWLDERSRVLMAERALSGDPWLTLGSRGFEVDFPVSAEAASGALRELAKGDDIFNGALLANLRHLSIDPERAVARFGDVPSLGLVRLSLRRDDVTYSPALSDALANRGIVIPNALPTEFEALRLTR